MKKTKKEEINIKEYLKPNFTYIPFDNRRLLDIKLNMETYKNILLGKTNNNENIYTTTSGKLIDLKEITTINAETNSIVIENDFKEKTKKYIPTTKNISKLTKEEILELLKAFNLNKYFLKKYQKLCINIEYSFTNRSESLLLNDYVDQFLEIVEYLKRIFDFKEVEIIVNKKDKMSLENMKSFLGMYPSFKMINISNENNFIKKIYQKLDPEDLLLLNITDIYQIFFAIKKRLNISEMYTTVFSKKMLKPIYVKVKIGTSVKELLEFLNIDYTIQYLNETQFKKEDLFLVITKDLKSINIR